jgi:hypothetical protein
MDSPSKSEKIYTLSMIDLALLSPRRDEGRGKMEKVSLYSKYHPLLYVTPPHSRGNGQEAKKGTFTKGVVNQQRGSLQRYVVCCHEQVECDQGPRAGSVNQ